MSSASTLQALLKCPSGCAKPCVPCFFSSSQHLSLSSPASALAARAASGLCCCSFQRHRARTADGHPGHGGQGTAPLIARQASFRTLRCTISGEAFRKGHGTRGREPTISSKLGCETRSRNSQMGLGAHSQHNSRGHNSKARVM